MMTTIREKLAAIFRPKPRTGVCDTCVCDTCAFVDFFRSNGDGQTARLQVFCRCPGGPYEDRPAPPERRCPRWQAATGPIEKPRVGDPTLTV